MRESALRKELLTLQKAVGVPTPEPEPEKPAAEAAAEAPAPAQKALSKRSLAAEVAMLSGPPAAVVPQLEGDRDAAALANNDAAEPGAAAEQTSTAAGSADAAVAVPMPMQEDGAAAAAATTAAAPEAVAAAVDPLQALKEELLAVLDWVPFDAFHSVRGSPERREQLRGVVLAAHTSKVRAWQQWGPCLMQVGLQAAHSESRLPTLSAKQPPRCASSASCCWFRQAPIEVPGSATLLCATISLRRSGGCF